MIVNFVQKLLVFTKLDWTGNFIKVKRRVIPLESRVTAWFWKGFNKKNRMNGKIHIISDIKYKAMEQRNKFIGNARPPFD